MKYITVLAFIFLLCSQRDLSTPAKRLVGHWQYTGGAHVYFDAVDSKTKIGSYIHLTPDSIISHHYYKILSESLSGIELEVEDEKHLSNRVIYVLSKDGVKLTIRVLLAGDSEWVRMYNADTILTDLKARYFDAKTKPG